MPTGSLRHHEVKRRMQGAHPSLSRTSAACAAGRARPRWLEPVGRSDAYGTHMPLNQLATVSGAESRGGDDLGAGWEPSRWSRPWRRRLCDSNLGLVAATEGQVLRLRIPELNEETPQGARQGRATNTRKRPRSRCAMCAATGCDTRHRSIEKTHEISEMIRAVRQ